MTIKKLNTLAIRIDGGTQARASINLDTVAEYKAAYEGEIAMPPVIVFWDGTDYWLADGFHRWHAVHGLGRPAIDAEVRQGTQRDAILFAIGANAAHGLKRSNEDKRKAVAMLLADAEWAQWSDRELARRAGVDHKTVAAVRADAQAGSVNGEFPIEKPAPERKFKNKHGGESKRKVEPKVVGGASAKAPAPAPAEAPAAAPATEAQEMAEAAFGDSDPVALLEETQKELEAAQELLKAAEADDLKAEAIKWRNLHAVAERRQHELMARVNDREKELNRVALIVAGVGNAVQEPDSRKLVAKVKALAVEAKALGAELDMVGLAVGETDRSKIAETVEMFVKGMQEAA